MDVVLLLLAVVLAIAGVLASSWLKHQEKTQKKLQLEKSVEQHEAFLTEVDAVVQRHLRVLASKYKQTTYEDEYGELELKDWVREADKFIDRFVEPIALDKGVAIDRADIFARVTKAAIDERYAAPERYSAHVVTGDGEGFEDYCKEQLQALGLEVTKTKGGADQGVDLIADHRDFRAAIQCKNYTRPVGNSAVQEVLAGAAFYSPPQAIPVVVSRSGFTPAACELAQGADVLLIDAHDLDNFDILLIGEALSRARSAT
ncbi:restriction endonuclease [uncultured Reyranella sp.]|uniref:restriction endonuclease n=1 Tax=uncultured Reyranella sp. TaxID=735512 RepID=UPI0025F67579|nr:restriction endonuclease [uncultured Reyranella sp.]